MQLSVQADKRASFPLLAYWLFLPQVCFPKLEHCQADSPLFCLAQ